MPLNPDTGAPFVGLNPPVTDTDFARSTSINPNIELTKSVDPTVVLLGPDGAPEPVTYTFEATNTGTPALNRPGAATAGPAQGSGLDRGHPLQSPATYADTDGDANDNDLLDPGETWTFTCPGSVAEPTLNFAGILAQPSDGTGAPLPGVDPVGDLALAQVQVLRPGITVAKTALVGVVLDAGAVLPAGASRRPRRAGPGRADASSGRVPVRGHQHRQRPARPSTRTRRSRGRHLRPARVRRGRHRRRRPPRRRRDVGLHVLDPARSGPEQRRPAAG